MLIVTIRFYDNVGNETDSPETFGPFDNEDTRNEWVDALIESAANDPENNRLLTATFTLDKLTAPFQVPVTA